MRIAFTRQFAIHFLEIYTNSQENENIKNMSNAELGEELIKSGAVHKYDFSGVYPNIDYIPKHYVLGDWDNTV